jgi:HNH endonuclease
MITPEQIRNMFFYNSRTGVLRWKKLEGRRKAGPLGSIDSKGYLAIHIRPHMYRLHRIIWAWKTGKWPLGEIDHKNGVRTDNRWNNLRNATRIQQNANQKPRKNNTSGFRGVYWLTDSKKYAAVIHLNGKKTYLGYDKNLKRAAAIYKKAAKKHFGEFSRAP